MMFKRREIYWWISVFAVFVIVMCTVSYVIFSHSYDYWRFKVFINRNFPNYSVRQERDINRRRQQYVLVARPSGKAKSDSRIYFIIEARSFERYLGFENMKITSLNFPVNFPMNMNLQHIDFKRCEIVDCTWINSIPGPIGVAFWECKPSDIQSGLGSFRLTFNEENLLIYKKK